VVPGAVALPGGHIEPGESPEEALYREVREEIGIIPTETVYVCTLLHRSQEFRKLHYFAVTSWKGEIVSQEAESLLWIPLRALETLDLDIDKIAVHEYLRVYKPWWTAAADEPPSFVFSAAGKHQRKPEADLVEHEKSWAL
jgi:8-oxo-dGTP diphosphatase